MKTGCVTYYSAFLLVLAALILVRASEEKKKCHRQFKDPGPDCVTVSGPPCLMETEGGMPVRLPYPKPNHRLLFRTCIVEGTEDCFGTLKKNNTLRKNNRVNRRDYSYKIHSPNFMESKNYLKSTVVRYDITCDEDQIIAYSFAQHTLEVHERCADCEECVDWLNIDFPDFHHKNKSFCGTEVPILKMAPTNHMIAEFVSNRKVEDLGFVMFIYCTQSHIGEPPDHMGLIGPDMCTRPPVLTPRECLDPLECLHSFFPDEKENIDMRSITTVNINGRIHYSDYTIEVLTESGESTTFSQIKTLHVQDLFSEKQSYEADTDHHILGFGHLGFLEDEAYFVQLGISPTLKPSLEEEEIILELERGMSDILGSEDFSDIIDELDEDLQEVEVSTESDKLAEYALKYGNACNPVLRVAACTYQERVMKRDCETGKKIEEEEEEGEREKEAEKRRVQEQVQAEEQIRATGDSFFGQPASEQEEACLDPLDGQCQN